MVEHEAVGSHNANYEQDVTSTPFGFPDALTNCPCLPHAGEDVNEWRLLYEQDQASGLHAHAAARQGEGRLRALMGLIPVIRNLAANQVPVPDEDDKGQVRPVLEMCAMACALRDRLDIIMQQEVLPPSHSMQCSPLSLEVTLCWAGLLSMAPGQGSDGCTDAGCTVCEMMDTGQPQGLHPHTRFHAGT